ncbi:MAG: antitoxin VapB family protein [Candidatus Methanofastidiosia archaeon]|jgi:predicted CopG family antitoxin
MGSKSITISEEAYRRLKSKKKKNESFTDVINRITRERPLSEIAGILSEEEADSLEKHVKDRRRKTRSRINKI